MKILKLILPLFLLCTGIAFIFLFEFYLKDKVNTVPVLVASEDIHFKEELTKNNIKIMNIRRDNLVKGAYLYADEQKKVDMLGELAAIHISKGAQLYPALIDVYNLVPNEEKGEFIAPIPNQWILAIPGSLRRSYYADFYVIPKEEKKNYTFDDRMEPILTNVRVVHTKDSSNREVRNTQEKKHDSTANITNIEIISNQEMLNTLKRYIDLGYKLYITYKYGTEED